VNKWWNKLNSETGKIEIRLFIFVVVAITLTLAFAPIIDIGIVNNNVQAATDYLNDRGYVVLSSQEYSTINAKLDAIKNSADVAVLNANEAVVEAQNAVIAAQIAAAKVDLYNSAEIFIYPEQTNYACTLSANDIANSFSSWLEITDNSSTTLSSKFVDDNGYLAEILAFEFSVPNVAYILEISYGEDNIVIGRLAFYARANAISSVLVKSHIIPKNQKIYYRVMCETGGASFRAYLRYFYE
jgi:hypothetical protein